MLLIQTFCLCKFCGETYVQKAWKNCALHQLLTVPNIHLAHAGLYDCSILFPPPAKLAILLAYIKFLTLSIVFFDPDTLHIRQKLITDERTTNFCPFMHSPLSHRASRLFSHASVISHIKEWTPATFPKGKKQKWQAHSTLNCWILWLLNYLWLVNLNTMNMCVCVKNSAYVNKVHYAAI